MNPHTTSGRRIRTLAAVVATAASLLVANAVRSDHPDDTAYPWSEVAVDGTAEPVPQAPTGTAGTDGLTRGTRRAYGAAASAMRADGIGITLTSGHRSAAVQEQLYRQAIEKYGSVEEARVWVLPPDESRHVRGVAVDVAPKQAARWLDRNGARFGLCRTMEWEWWHFEYDAAWDRADDCPPPRRRL
jgi:D-alanyl-D-alanine carboxypeptidase